jgi:hypothetical protein
MIVFVNIEKGKKYFDATDGFTMNSAWVIANG